MRALPEEYDCSHDDVAYVPGVATQIQSITHCVLICKALQVYNFCEACVMCNLVMTYVVLRLAKIFDVVSS